MLLRGPKNLDIQVASVSYGMTERPNFLALPLEDQRAMAEKHPDNQDYYSDLVAVGLIMADGVSLSGKGTNKERSRKVAAGSRAAVLGFRNYLLRNGSCNEKREIVEEMLPYAADAATAAMREACGEDDEGNINGSTTLTGHLRTKKLQEWLRFHAGDSRSLHARYKGFWLPRPHVVSTSVDQSLRVNEDGKFVGPDEDGKNRLVNYFGSDHSKRFTDPRVFAGTRFAEHAHLLVDKTEPVDAKPGDLLISYTDGLEVGSPEGGHAIDPQLVAETALRHEKPQDSVAALLTLPDEVAKAWNEKLDINHFYPQFDDLTIVLGRIIAR